ncbi:EamA family transporter [Nonomuraea dietziae]|uniref:EamA family transporter n=1 Tax=Nonomuraea dietziae TaxID=65515 RepID=UPI0031E0ADD4
MWARMAGAGLLLLAVLVVVKPRALRIPRSRLPFFGAYAVMAVAGVQALYFVAITRLPVGIALLLEFMAPVMVVLWGPFRPQGTAAAGRVRRGCGRRRGARHRRGGLGRACGSTCSACSSAWRRAPAARDTS